MIRKLLVLILVILTGCVAPEIKDTFQKTSRAEQIRSELSNTTLKRVFVVAHRACSKNAPENSRLAVVNAINMGVDIIEIDIRKTKDGKFILMHDTTVNRTTNGKGQIKNLTLKQLRKLHLKGHDSQLSKETIPTLSEILKLAKGKVMINLDKAEPYFNEILPLLKSTGVSRQVIFKGGANPKEVYECLGIDSSVIYMPILWIDKKQKVLRNNKGLFNLYEIFPLNKQVRMVELVFDNLDDPAVSSDVMQSFKDAKVRSWINTLEVAHPIGYSDNEALKNPDRIWGTLIQKGFSIIQTDEPKVLLDYLRIKKLHN
ncbi:glycerophosphodiester phosphodiesterase [Methanosarcinales archaeon]|nr:MAG: glycerophosphodiester phosphodiesterase [Methanosarcinales archaeon]